MPRHAERESPRPPRYLRMWRRHARAWPSPMAAHTDVAATPAAVQMPPAASDAPAAPFAVPDASEPEWVAPAWKKVAVGQTIALSTSVIDQDLDETRVIATRLPASARFDAVRAVRRVQEALPRHRSRARLLEGGWRARPQARVLRVAGRGRRLLHLRLPRERRLVLLLSTAAGPTSAPRSRSRRASTSRRPSRAPSPRR